MKVILVSPGLDEDHSEEFRYARKFRESFPCLGLPWLAALTPSNIEVKIIDEVHGLIQDYEEADLVGITAWTMHARRAYKIADVYRQKGIPVVLGGIHFSFLPEEAAPHANSVVVGEAEEIWPNLLKDFQANQLKPLYKAPGYPSLDGLPIPRRDLMDGPGYRPPRGILNAVQATRGCPFACNFCCVTQMFGRTLRTRPIPGVIDELETIDATAVAIIDDNIIGNLKYAKELFTEMIPLEKKWTSQASISIARHDDLLKLAAESGCTSLYIGIETINPTNIIDINKKINKVEEYEDAIKKIHNHGIKIRGSFIVGLDDDDESTFDDIFDFINHNHIDYPTVGIMTPLPGTQLFEKLKKEGRILTYDWNKYNLNEVVYKPKKMSPEKLYSLYLQLYKNIARTRYASSFKVSDIGRRASDKYKGVYSNIDF